MSFLLEIMFAGRIYVENKNMFCFRNHVLILQYKQDHLKGICQIKEIVLSIKFGG